MHCVRCLAPPHSQPRALRHTYCAVQHHVPIDPYAERMPRADCSSNTIRDSISRVAPSLRGPRFAPALRHARRPCALTRGRPAVPRQPANVMVKHHAEGELPQWVFSMCSQSQISGIQPIPQRPLQLIRPITISDSLGKNQVIPDNTWSCPGIPERYPGFSRG